MSTRGQLQMTTRNWKMVFRVRGGQRFFMCPEKPFEIAVADNSGRTPDMTEDGPLWIDMSRPWSLGDSTFGMPVAMERDPENNQAWVGEKNDFLFDLLEALRSPEVLGEKALNIEIRIDKHGAGMGARAIMKCLAMGVKP